MEHWGPVLLEAYKRTKINIFTDAWVKESVYFSLLCQVLLHGELFSIAPFPIWTKDQGVTDMVKYIQMLCEGDIEATGQYQILVLPGFVDIPGCAAVKGLSTTERRKEGKVGGIGIIFIAGVLAKKGESALDWIGGNPDFIEVVSVTADSKDRYKLLNSMKMLMADLEQIIKLENVGSWVSEDAPHGFHEPAPEPIWAASDEYKGRLAYITCREDCMIPYRRQLEMERATACRVLEAPGSHLGLYLLDPKATANKITDFARQFVKEEVGNRPAGPQTLKQHEWEVKKAMRKYFMD